jgi:hypothetical protein
LVLLIRQVSKLVNHACIGHKLVDYILLNILIYNTPFSDKQIIFCEFYNICNNSEMFLEIKIGCRGFLHRGLTDPGTLTGGA